MFHLFLGCVIAGADPYSEHASMMQLNVDGSGHVGGYDSSSAVIKRLAASMQTLQERVDELEKRAVMPDASLLSSEPNAISSDDDESEVEYPWDVTEVDWPDAAGSDDDEKPEPEAALITTGAQEKIAPWESWHNRWQIVLMHGSLTQGYDSWYANTGCKLSARFYWTDGTTSPWGVCSGWTEWGHHVGYTCTPDGTFVDGFMAPEGQVRPDGTTPYGGVGAKTGDATTQYTKIEVTIDGEDAFFIDEAWATRNLGPEGRIERQDFAFFNWAQWWGRVGGGGYCLSTDSADTFTMKDGTTRCYRTFWFYPSGRVTRSWQR